MLIGKVTPPKAGYGPPLPMPNVRIFGLTIQDIGLSRALETIQGFLRTGARHLVVTANPEILVYAKQHPGYHGALHQASLILPDGVGLVAVSWLIGQPILSGRVTGVDLAEQLVKLSTSGNFSVFLVGERNEVLQKATQYFINKYEKVNIVSYVNGPIFTPDSTFPLTNETNDKLLQQIREKKPDLLLVGFGHPKQELWLSHYLPSLPVKVGIGIGGSFDYFAGAVARAPGAIRSLGLEWLWRLIIQPWRWKRITTAVVIFPCLAIFEALAGLFHVEQK